MKKIKENNHAFIFKIFFAIGLVLLIVGGTFLVKNIIDKNNSIQINAIITDIRHYEDTNGNIEHTTYVYYVYEGKEYKNIEVDSYNNSWEIFDEIIVNIVKNNPGKVVSDRDFIPLVIISGIGLIFTLLGGILTVKLSIKTRKQKKVKKTGEKVKCYISEILPDTSYTVNGRFVNSILTCRPVEKNNSAEYKSNSHKTSNLLQVNNIIYVYIDNQNPENYYVDLNSGTGEIYLEETKLEQNQVLNKTHQCDYCGSIISGNGDKCPNCKAGLKKQ